MARADTRARLSRALRQAYESAGMTQTGLADATSIDQQTISKYARGAVTPPLEAIVAIEDACHLERGHVLRLAGFVADTVSSEGALTSDPALDDSGREMVLAAYQFAVDRARKGADERARAGLARRRAERAAERAD